MGNIRIWSAWLLLLLRIGDAVEINIGVVSSSPEKSLQLAAAAEAALSAVDKLDPDRELQWKVIVAPVVPDKPVSMPDQICAQAAQGVSAIVADGKPHEIELAVQAAARSGVPLLLVSPTSLTVEPEALQQWEAMHMYPQTYIFMKVCADLCTEKDWTSAVLLHEGPVGAQLVQGIADAGADMDILARRLPPEDDEIALRNLLVILKKAGHTQFIVWCDEICSNRVLAQAQKVGLLAERNAYILLALDIHTLDMEPYSHGGANITGLQLFDPTDEDDCELIEAAWKKYLEEVESEQVNKEEIQLVRSTSLILTYDVVFHAASVLSNLPRELDSSAVCDPYKYQLYADTLINYLRSEDWSDKAGQRRAGWLRVGEVVRGGQLEYTAMWDHDSVLWNRTNVAEPPQVPGQMANQTFKVLIAINKPYVMMKDSTEKLSGNDRYEGFGIQLIEELAELLKFKYIFIEQVDRNYTTMMLRINSSATDHEVDFAITDLTITADREQQVDFTTPFMNLGISIMYSKPTAPDPKLFAFMLPFSTGVWFCLGLAYVGTSLVLYVVGRLCPEEWQNPYPCIEEPQALENQFTIANALWFNLGAVLLQGSEIAPVAYGSRAVASAWWLFALVITSSYTANLATLLAKKNNNEDFTNYAELANNDKGITYGAKMDGATYKFFNNSQDPTFKKIFNNMKQWTMPNENDIGIEWVKDENKKFAFFMESTSIEYNIERDCNLTQVGGLLDSKGYGIAMAKDSPYRQALNLALLNLQETGQLRAMKHRWWKEMHGGGACNAEDEHESQKLTIKNFMGLFLVLGVGCVLGIFISLADLMLAARNKDRDPDSSYWRRVAQELRFVFHLQLSEKPVQGPLLPPPSPDTEAGSEHQEDKEAEEAEPENRENIGSRMRSSSFQSSARRRSSLHNASVRLARHTRRDSSRSRRHNGDS